MGILDGMNSMAGAYYPLDIFFDNPATGFVITFILNIVYFAIIGYVFIRPSLEKTSLHKFLIGMLALTAAGTAANLMPFYVFGILNVASYLPHFILSLGSLLVMNFVVASYHFKAPAKGSVVVAIIMAVLTNAYLIWVMYAP